jgi:hypothetical protein
MKLNLMHDSFVPSRKADHRGISQPNTSALTADHLGIHHRPHHCASQHGACKASPDVTLIVVLLEHVT